MSIPCEFWDAEAEECRVARWANARTGDETDEEIAAALEAP